MADKAHEPKTDRTHQGIPFASALDRVLKDNAAHPEDVYRLAILMQGLLDSLESPEALETIRFELRALINDISLSQVVSGNH